MTAPFPTAEAIEELLRLHGEATPGQWKLWAADVLADQDGSSDREKAKLVARTFFLNDRGQHRTNDAELIATMQRSLPSLLAAASFALKAAEFLRSMDVVAQDTLECPCCLLLSVNEEGRPVRTVQHARDCQLEELLRSLPERP